MTTVQGVNTIIKNGLFTTFLPVAVTVGNYLSVKLEFNRRGRIIEVTDSLGHTFQMNKKRKWTTRISRTGNCLVSVLVMGMTGISRITVEEWRTPPDGEEGKPQRKE